MSNIRRPVPIRPLLLGVAFAVAPFLASCGSETGDPFVPTEPAKGGLTVNAVVEDQGVSGVQFLIEGPDTLSGTTNVSGSVLFSPIRPGSYTVELTSSPATVEFIRTSLTVMVPAGGLASLSFLGQSVSGSPVGWGPTP